MNQRPKRTVDFLVLTESAPWECFSAKESISRFPPFNTSTPVRLRSFTYMYDVHLKNGI